MLSVNIKKATLLTE